MKLPKEVSALAETLTLTLEFPKSFVEGLWADEVQATKAIKQAAVVDLLRQRAISLRRGAELLGLTYREFQQLASHHKITLFDCEDGWADRELSALKPLGPES